MNNEQNNEINKDSDFFLLKMIRGDYGLFQTFWFFSFIPSLIFNLFLAIFQNKMSDDIRLFLILLMSLYSILVFIGIWKSANNYLGNRIWVFLSKLSVAMGILLLILSSIALFGLSSYNDVLISKANNEPIAKNISSAEEKDLNFEIVNFTYYSKYSVHQFIKDCNGNYFLIIKSQWEPNTEVEVKVYDKNIFYYDNFTKNLNTGDFTFPLSRLLERQENINSDYHSEIYLKNGEYYKSLDLSYFELVLITFAPEYINEIDFYNRTTKIN